MSEITRSVLGCGGQVTVDSITVIEGLLRFCSEGSVLAGACKWMTEEELRFDQSFFDAKAAKRGKGAKRKDKLTQRR
jgi:hypothetical protein